jgi:glycosyltransferase involved in cell wall biosynthesis
MLIAIPVFNEAASLARVLRQVHGFHPDILVVDDGSTDATPDLLTSLKPELALRVIRHPTNRGYGQSLIDAFALADREGFDWVITMDCDEQHEPGMIPDFIRMIEPDRWDIISGSRYMQPRTDDDLPPVDRRNINATLTAMLNDLFNLGLTDAFCGFKAHRVSAMRRLRLDEPGYAFPMQLWPQVAWAGLRLTEIPVRLIYRDANRHFGGDLDDPQHRLRHYLRVLHHQVLRLAAEPPPGLNEPAAVCGCAS